MSKQGNNTEVAFIVEGNADPETTDFHESDKWKKQSLRLQSQSKAMNDSHTSCESGKPDKFFGQSYDDPYGRRHDVSNQVVPCSCERMMVA